MIWRQKSTSSPLPMLLMVVDIEKIYQTMNINNSHTLIYLFKVCNCVVIIKLKLKFESLIYYDNDKMSPC